MKNLKLIAFIIALNFPILYFGVDWKSHPAKALQPVYVPYYYNGQILLPDYVSSDTMVVIDAIGLNKALAPIEQGLCCPDFGSDADYADLFSEFTLPLADYNRDSALINKITFTKY